jgi:hypothetical protein
MAGCGVRGGAAGGVRGSPADRARAFHSDITATTASTAMMNAGDAQTGMV